MCGSSASGAYGRGGTSKAMKLFSSDRRTRCGLYPRRLRDHRDPPLPTPAPDRARTARRRRGDLAQAHGPRRARASTRRRTVVLAAGGLARASEGRPDHPRGDRRGRRPGDADAGPAAGRTLAQDRPLRHRRAAQAQGPQGRRHGARDDARGVRDDARRTGRALVPRPAIQPLSLPDQGARRAAATRRCSAHPRVHHEGRLHVRP